tara:strand:+ start:255 stop:659 length:405 start_codon:yes stop_codon:yes gene_type:complete
MFEEIDQLINKLKSEEEIYNYVNKNIYPERLKFSHKVKYIPPIKETMFPEIALEDISHYCLGIKQKINIIDNTIQLVKEHFHNNNCPICFNKIGDKNYIVPDCGHKVCIKCFVCNLHTNKTTGNLCSICREIIV